MRAAGSGWECTARRREGRGFLVCQGSQLRSWQCWRCPLLTCDPHMSLKKQDDPAWSQVPGMQLAALQHSTDASRRVRTSAPRPSSTSRVLICWSCHSANATLGTLKPTVSNDDERVAHRGRHVQRQCRSCATLLAPTSHMNGCRWRGVHGPDPPLD